MSLCFSPRGSTPALGFFLGSLIAGAIAVAGCGSTADDAAAPPSVSPEAGGDAPAVPVDAARADDAAADAPIDVPSVPVAGVCTQAAQKICAFLTTCSPTVIDGLFETPADCVPRFESICIGPYPVASEVRKDDADAFGACLGALTCDDVYGPAWSIKCVAPRLKTTLPVGAACRMRGECESGSCSGSSTTCGTCVKRVKAGAACTTAAECPLGGYCSTTCYAPAFLGQSCDMYNVCGNGLKCTAGTCAKAGGVGTTCNSDQDCDFPAQIYCNRGTKLCETATLAQPGDPCPPAFNPGSPVLCAKGSNCIRPGASGTPGTCVAPQKVGEACDANKRCESLINCRNDKCVLPSYVACP